MHMRCDLIRMHRAGRAGCEGRGTGHQVGDRDTRRGGGSRGDGRKELGLQVSSLKESVQGRAARARNGPPRSWRAACGVSCGGVGSVGPR